MDELHYISEIQATIPQVMNYFWKGLLQKKVNLVLRSWSNPASRKLTRRIQCSIRKKPFLLKKGSGMTFLACESFKGDSLSAEISKLVMRLVRRYDQDERATDGAVHWNSMNPILRKAFQKFGGQKFSDTDRLQHMYHGSNKMRFQYCMNCQHVRRACEPRICITWTPTSFLHVAILVSQVVPVLSQLECCSSVSTLRQKFVSLWFRHRRRVSRGLSGKSSSAIMLITKRIPKGTPSILWIAPRRMAGLMSKRWWIFACAHRLAS